jgi:MerR family regulatory protein
MTARKSLPTLRADGHGYVLDGRSVDGFGDPEAESLGVRTLVARFGSAYAPEALTDAQKQLLGSTMAREKPVSSVLLRALADDEADVARASEAGLLGLLSEDDLRKAALPEYDDAPASSEGQVGGPYPLTSGEVIRLTGTTARQLRYWEEAGLLSSFRPGKQRRYLQGAVLRAFALARQPPYVVAFLRALQADPESLARVLSATLSSGTVEQRDRISTALRGTVGFLDQVNRAATSDGGQSPLAIVLSGRPLSGKSHVAQTLAASLGADRVSFGEYVRHRAAATSGASDSLALLDLGAELFKTLGATRLVHETFAFYGTPFSKQYIVIDDVLHDAVFDVLLEQFPRTLHFEVCRSAAAGLDHLETLGVPEGLLEGHPLNAAFRSLLEHHPPTIRVDGADPDDAVREIEAALAA